ncbi:MAG: hypothetical protein Q9193_001522 [Seirophora villosa]
MDEDSPVWDRKVHDVPEWLNKNVLERFPHRTMALKKYEVLCAMHNQVSTRYPDPKILTYPFHLAYLHVIHRRPRIDVHMLWKHILQLLDGCLPDFLIKKSVGWSLQLSGSVATRMGTVLLSSIWDSVVLCMEMALETALRATIEVITKGGSLSIPTAWHVADSIRVPLPVHNVVYERLADVRMGMRAATLTFQVLLVTDKLFPYPRKNLKAVEEKLRPLFKSELLSEIEWSAD